MSVVAFRPRSSMGIRIDPLPCHSDDGRSAWDLEFDLHDLAQQSVGCHFRAWELDELGRGTDAEAYLDLADALDDEWDETKAELVRLERGF